MVSKEKEAVEIAKDYFLYNGDLLPSREFNLDKAVAYPAFYEVIRLVDGVALFFEEHMERLWTSMKLLGYRQVFDDQLIKEHISRLLDANQAYNYNVKIIVNNLDGPRANLFVYYIQSSYPEDILYQQGVPAILYRAERRNPNAKLIAADFRLRINQSLREAQAYEALLVNPRGEITEGSRSNLFFVKGNTLYTPPARRVLEGITRKYIIKLSSQLGYRLVEEPVDLDFLKDVEGVFLTGTSPKVLPIASIDGHGYESTRIRPIRDLQAAYDDLIYDYVSKNKLSL